MDAFVDFEACGEGLRPGEIVVVGIPSGRVSPFMTDFVGLELRTLAQCFLMKPRSLGNSLEDWGKLLARPYDLPVKEEAWSVVRDLHPPHPTDPHRPRAHHPRSPKRSRR